MCRVLYSIYNSELSGDHDSMNVRDIRLSSVPAGLGIVALGLLWGADFPAIDVVVTQLPPLGTAGLRFAVSGCIVLGYARLRTTRLRLRGVRELLAVVLVGGLTFAGYQGALYLGTQHVTGAVAAVVSTTMPVVVALVAIPLLGESRSLVDGLGFCLGAAGVLIISQPSVGTGLSATTLGVGLVFLGTVLFALGSVTVQALDQGLPVETLQGWAMLVGAAVLFGGALLRGETVPDPQVLSPAVVGSLLYIVASGAVGYLLFFRLVRRVGATETTLVTYLEPVSATAVSVLLLNRTIDGATAVGFLAVAAGFTVVSRETMRQTIGRFRDTGTPHAGHDPGGD